jgi:hypothetical protein
MAQIRIEEKKTGSVIPWVLGLILLGFVVWAGFALLDNEDNNTVLLDTEEVNVPLAEMATEITDDINVNVYQNSVDKFMDYTATMTGEMGLDHEFSHNALTYLADATEDVADAYNVDITSNTKRAKELANAIIVDPYATNHADMIRMAAINITETMERIDKWALDYTVADQISKLRKEAQAINSNTLTLNQKEDVRSFFGAARNVLSTLE